MDCDGSLCEAMRKEVRVQVLRITGSGGLLGLDAFKTPIYMNYL